MLKIIHLKKRGYLSLNIISVWLLLINLYVHSRATQSWHQDVPWKKGECPVTTYWVTRSSCVYWKKQVLKITRKVIFTVAWSSQITAQVGGGAPACCMEEESVSMDALQKCFYKHERLQTCWPSQEWFTSIVAKKQPMLMFFVTSQTLTVSNEKERMTNSWIWRILWPEDIPDTSAAVVMSRVEPDSL